MTLGKHTQYEGDQTKRKKPINTTPRKKKQKTFKRILFVMESGKFTIPESDERGKMIHEQDR